MKVIKASAETRLEVAGKLEGTELAQYLINDNQFYEKRALRIIELLQKKVKRGVYDHSLAWKAFLSTVQEGAKRYAKLYATGNTRQIFSPNDERDAAKEIADHYRSTIEQTEDASMSNVVKKSAKARLEVVAYDDSFPEVIQKVIAALNDVTPSLRVREDSITDSYGTWSIPLITNTAGAIALVTLDQMIKKLAPILKNTRYRSFLLKAKEGFVLTVEIPEKK